MLKQNRHPCCLPSAKRPYYCPFLRRRFSSRLRFQTSLGQATDPSLLLLLWSRMASAVQRPSKQAKEGGSCSIQHLFAAREREFPSSSSSTTTTSSSSSSPPREPRHTPTLSLSVRLLSHGFWTRPVLALLSGRYSAQLSLSDSPQARGDKRKSHNGFSCPVAFSLGASSSIRKAAAPGEKWLAWHLARAAPLSCPRKALAKRSVAARLLLPPLRSPTLSSRLPPPPPSSPPAALRSVALLVGLAAQEPGLTAGNASRARAKLLAKPPSRSLAPSSPLVARSPLIGQPDKSFCGDG